MVAYTSFRSVTEDNTLSHYLNEAWKFPILKKETEVKLAKKLQKTGDIKAAHQLVTSHLRLVAKIAMGYRGYGLPVIDLVAEGNIGLMKAVKKFDPELGFRLSTYAMLWIRASITEYVLRSWSLVKIGALASQKKMFFKLRKLKENLKIIDNGELDPKQAKDISRILRASEKEVLIMNRRLSGRDLSLNSPTTDGKEGEEYQDKLVSPSSSPETIYSNLEEWSYRRNIVNSAIQSLSERERNIFVERRLKENPMTLSELGKIYNVSRERIRQIENSAFQKVGKGVKKITKTHDCES